MCLWQSGRVSVSHAGDNEFEPSNLFKIILFLLLNSLNSVKTFRKNSNDSVTVVKLALHIGFTSLCKWMNASQYNNRKGDGFPRISTKVQNDFQELIEFNNSETVRSESGNSY